MAYIKKIKQNSADSHQTSPAYMLTFLPWGNRDTENRPNEGDFLDLKEPIIVVNDCVNLSVNFSKKNFVHTANMVLLAGDINYSTAICPGDFVLINMLDWDEKLFGKNGSPSKPTTESLFYRAKNKKAINKAHDGFKGVFRVQSVRRTLQTNASTGAKQFFYQIQAHAFTEFNQIIYFNSYLYSETEREGDKFRLMSGVSRDMSDLVDKKPLSMRSCFKRLVNYLIGVGFPSDYGPQKDVPRKFNYNFYVPPTIGQYLGLTNVKRAADIFTYYNGIQQFRNNAASDEIGLNPEGTRDGTFIDCGPTPRGAMVLIGEYWNQVNAWSIINQHANTTLNEMYTAFKLTPEGRVLPSVVYRQKPFTSKHFKKKFGKHEATEFLSLPRWQIDPAMVHSYSLGRDEAARINFVQVIGKSRGLPITSELALQSALESFEIDDKDVQRNGLKPFITACDFDFPTDEKKISQAPVWNDLVFDWLNNGHLKENGQVTCAGIEEPITVGDNFQVDDYVFHIEDVSHTMSISPDGMKKFETTLKLSYGVDLNSTETAPVYPETEFTYIDDLRKDDWDNGDRVLPGFSDDQVSAKNTRGTKQQTTGNRKNKIEQKAKKFKK